MAQVGDVEFEGFDCRFFCCELGLEVFVCRSVGGGGPAFLLGGSGVCELTLKGGDFCFLGGVLVVSDGQVGDNYHVRVVRLRCPSSLRFQLFVAGLCSRLASHAALPALLPDWPSSPHLSSTERSPPRVRVSSPFVACRYPPLHPSQHLVLMLKVTSRRMTPHRHRLPIGFV